LHHRAASAVGARHAARLQADASWDGAHRHALRYERRARVRGRRRLARRAIRRRRRGGRGQGRGRDQQGAAGRGARQMKLVANKPEPELAVDRKPVDVRSAALTTLAVIAVVLLLQCAPSMIIPIVLGVLISYAVDPLVDVIARRRVPRPIGGALVLLLIVGEGGGLRYGLRGQANALA